MRGHMSNVVPGLTWVFMARCPPSLPVKSIADFLAYDHSIVEGYDPSLEVAVCLFVLLHAFGPMIGRVGVRFTIKGTGFSLTPSSWMLEARITTNSCRKQVAEAIAFESGTPSTRAAQRSSTRPLVKIAPPTVTAAVAFKSRIDSFHGGSFPGFSESQSVSQCREVERTRESLCDCVGERPMACLSRVTPSYLYRPLLYLESD